MSRKRWIEAGDYPPGHPIREQIERAQRAGAQPAARAPAVPAGEGGPQRYPVVPVGKPRMTRRDRWAKRPAVVRYRAFKDQVRELGITLPKSGARVTFVLPMPRSWSRSLREAMNGRPHEQKPDVDNLAKALLDALFDDDAAIHDMRVTKRWGEDGEIVVETMGGL